MPKTIVVIDDEKNVCGLLKQVFEAEGYKVMAINDPEEGVNLVKKEKPDCVLLDVKMPKMSGVDVLMEIREVNKKVGIIMITGYGNLENALECMKLGAFDYITKPFDIKFVKDMVKNFLEKV